MIIGIGYFIGSGNTTIPTGTPSQQATNVTFTGIESDSLSISWTRGNGANILVLVKASSAVNATPTDDNTYTANSVFGSGTQLGVGNYAVYSGSGTSVTVTGLTADTVYHIRLFEYTGSAGAEKYNTTLSTGNPNSQTTFTNEFQAKLDRATTLAITKPSLSWQITENAMVKQFLATTQWAEADKIYCIRNDGSKQFGEIELKNPSTNRLTEIPNGGALIFTPGEGTKSDGLAYYDAGFALSTMTQYQLDDCFIGMVIYNPPANTSQNTGTRSSTSNRATIIPRNNSNMLSTSVNSGTALNTTYTPSATFNFLSVKRDAGTQTNNANGTTSSSAIAAVGIPTSSYFVLATNNAGVTPGSQITASIGFICIGSKDLDGILSTVESFF